MSRVPHVDPDRARGATIRFMEPIVRSKPGTWFFKNISSRLDPLLMRATGGRLTTALNAVPEVTLSSTGARSGEPRSSVLVYFSDGDDVILMASSFGRPQHPAWFFNLRTTPECELHVGNQGGRYRATETLGEERDRLFEIAKRVYAGWGDYEQRVAGVRTIPVLRLSPLD